MKLDKTTRDWLLDLQTTNKIYLEGNLLKVIEVDSDDEEMKAYIAEATRKDKDSRRKRLEVTKQIQQRNRELQESELENLKVNKKLTVALNEAEDAKKLAEDAKDTALADLDVMQKKSQTELISTIVRVALFVIIGVGVITTTMYMVALLAGKDTQIIGSTWSNMFGILLTNAFSIVGTIMGVKYATEKDKDKKE